MHDRLRGVGIAGAVIGGGAVAAQSKINGALGGRLHDGFAAALISFGSGLILVALITAARTASRDGVHALLASLRNGSLRWWECLGGICGAALVASQGLTVTALGVAIFTVAIVAGQTLASLAVDRIGVGPHGPQPLTGPRVGGCRPHHRRGHPGRRGPLRFAQDPGVRIAAARRGRGDGVATGRQRPRARGLG